MKFGEKIHALRKEKGLTQEKLAHLLNVSPQAVSRWETGISFPDIALLAPIANLFDISTDELLGVDIQNKNLKISEYTNAYVKFASALDKSDELRQETLAMLREGVRLFPDNYLLKRQLAMVLCLNGNNINPDKDEKAEMCAICEDLIENEKDLKNKCRYIEMFCAYAELTDNAEKGKRLANQLPEVSGYNLKYLAMCTSNAKIKTELQVKRVFEAWGNLSDALLQLIIGGCNKSEEIISLRKKQEEINRILFDNDDVVRYEDFDEIKIAKAFYNSGDCQKAIDYLETTLRKWTKSHLLQNISSLRCDQLLPKETISDDEVKINAKGFIQLVKTSFPNLMKDARVVHLIMQAEHIIRR